MNRTCTSVAVSAALGVLAALSYADTARGADPTTADCLTASDSSLKFGNQHKLRAERSSLLTCAAPSCPTDIRKECVRRVDEVNAQIPTIVFSVKDPTGADLSAVRVTMDGEVIVDRLEGVAMSIDPGEHTFTFETAGQSPLTKKLIIVEAQKDRRELIQFGNPQAAAGGGASGGVAASTDGGLGTQKILAIVAGGIGVVGLGVGTAFGLLAISAKSDAQNVCPNQCTSQDGVNKWNTASTDGTIATIGFIAGGVALLGGAVLWVTAPSSSQQVGIGPGGLTWKGTW